jgi:hypothetical protein
MSEPIPDAGGGFAASILATQKPEDPAVKVNPDGSVDIFNINASVPRLVEGDDFYRNLADDIPSVDALAQLVIEGVDSDKQNRQQWMDNYRKGFELLGLEIEEIVGTKANKRNVSSVTHPLLLESVVRAQGMARAELLPANGPVKVTINGQSDMMLDALAKDLEDDLNLYLTNGAPEYYPDTDRGLFSVFLSGNWFRKVYYCPVRQRPVCESIEVEDLIVPNSTVSLDTASRITHQSQMSQGMMKRMQLFGDWRQVELGDPMPYQDIENVRQAKKNVLGLGGGTLTPNTNSYVIYETHLDLDPREYGWIEEGAPEGLMLPYVVTVEASSQKVLSIRRNWRPGDDRFMRRQMFVHYGMIPAFDFLCLGYVHLLGNSTRALTAAWRLLCDAGMFANFPGGLKIGGFRTGTNEIAPSPGEWFDIDANGIDDIRKLIMPLPYKDPSPVFIQFLSQIAQDSRQMAGTVMMETGEGRTNIPVGTIMAMIEQQTQISAVVHKRLHTAQAREFQLLKEVIQENPESIVKVIPNPRRRWLGQLAFNQVDLVPASDPNVPSQTHRVLLATSLIQMAQTNPDIYNKYAVHLRAWQTVGVKDAAEFLVPPQPQGPNPMMQAPLMAAQAQMVKAQADMQKVQNEQVDSQRKAMAEGMHAEIERQKAMIELELQRQQAAAKQQEHLMDLEMKRLEMLREQMQMAAAHRAQQEPKGEGHE